MGTETIFKFHSGYITTVIIEDMRKNGYTLNSTLVILLPGSFQNTKNPKLIFKFHSGYITTRTHHNRSYSSEL